MVALGVPSNDISEPYVTPYTALSHCWDTPAEMTMITNKAIHNRIQGIPIQSYYILFTLYNAYPVAFFPPTLKFSLPENFQHAIALNKRLGIHFPCIDSLCIIQNSKEDQETEGVQMNKIYNAYLVLAATSAIKTTDSFLQYQLADKANPDTYCVPRGTRSIADTKIIPQATDKHSA
ncbi:uncharacterized protein BDW43DRAFT_282886 [Aspergillus alliaceus]|uniref:uncharacterized protein n=1 Tax=Petromyces alliaceus TaxID=209559 RepID=UPI0012A6A4E7|nr:uncharacterized protein BDW43DRAFT_282886 [Aspergillus alliaceus]KAB8231391.1 hypothetical protein BDW43DRAFT_282886 [Aspergillus alliaceus]